MKTKECKIGGEITFFKWEASGKSIGQWVAQFTEKEIRSFVKRVQAREKPVKLRGGVR